MNRQSVPVPPQPASNTFFASSAILGAYNPTDTSHSPPQMANASSREQYRRSLVPKYTQQQVPVDSRKRPALDTFGETKSSVQTSKRRILPPTTHHSFEPVAGTSSPPAYTDMSSAAQSTLNNTPTPFRAYDQKVSFGPRHIQTSVVCGSATTSLVPTVEIQPPR